MRDRRNRWKAAVAEHDHLKLQSVQELMRFTESYYK